MPRLLAHANVYAPGHNGGAETTLHTLLLELVALGWDVRVLVAQARRGAYTWDGLPIEPAGPDRGLRAKYDWCDVALTHLHATGTAMMAARRSNKPLVHLVHNHRQLDRFRVRAGRCDLAVMNSLWVDEVIGWDGPTLVVHPISRVAHHAVARDGDAVTLVNCSIDKGGPLFWALAAARPDLLFQGVAGSYGGQVRPPAGLANVLWREHRPEMAEVYRATRVLVVPSKYESWGKAAVEALCSGIPVIAAPTPGLRESLTSPMFGDAAIFVEHEDTAGWLEALARLDDDDEWQQWSNRARGRAAELDAVADRQVKVLDDALRLLAGA